MDQLCSHKHIHTSTRRWSHDETISEKSRLYDSMGVEMQSEVCRDSLEHKFSTETYDSCNQMQTNTQESHKQNTFAFPLTVLHVCYTNIFHHVKNSVVDQFHSICIN